MADEYCNLLTRTPRAPANPVQLRATLQRLMIQLSQVEAERIALADAARFFIISDEQSKTIMPDTGKMALSKRASRRSPKTIHGLLWCAN